MKLTGQNKLALILLGTCFLVLIVIIGVFAMMPKTTTATTTPTTTTTQTQIDTSQDDKAINLVQNYKDPNGFTVATNLQGIINILDSGTSRTHQGVWSAKQIDNQNYEVTMMIMPDEFQGSGGGTAKWSVNVETGIITPLDENAKAFMNGISASSSSENSGSSDGYTIKTYTPASKPSKDLDPNIFKSDPEDVSNIKTTDKNEEEDDYSYDYYDYIERTG